MADHLEILRQHNAWRRGDIEEYPFEPADIGKAIEAAIAECELGRRAARNRDMWKEQCERQAEELPKLRAVVEKHFSVYREQSIELIELRSQLQLLRELGSGEDQSNG